MVGYPTNTSVYAPLRNDPGIRKISLCNFSLGDVVLDFNNPACILLDVSDLGFSYDISVTDGGVVSRKVKDKDIVLKILVNYKERTISAGTFVDWDATTYDALNDFLGKLGISKNSDVKDRRGIKSSTIPDLVLKWDTPSVNGVYADPNDNYGVLSRYRDVVISDIQWTEVDKQYQGIVVDLTLKPIGPWYYRHVIDITDIYLGTSYTTLPSGGNQRYILDTSVLPKDADLNSPIKYDLGICVKSHSNTTLNSVGCLQFRHSINTNEVFAAYMSFEYNSYNPRWSHFGNLRGTPYAINSTNAEWGALLPGSPNELYLLPEVNLGSCYFQAKVDGVTSPKVDVKIEYNIPITI